MTEFTDWAALLIGLASVAGCVGVVLVWLARFLRASIVGLIRPPRSAELLQPRVSGGRLLAAAAAFVVAAYLAGDVLAWRARHLLALPAGGWAELVAAAVSAIAGTALVIGSVGAVRRPRAVASP